MWLLIVIVVFFLIVVVALIRDLRRNPDPGLEPVPARGGEPPSEHTNGSSGWEGFNSVGDPGSGVAGL